MVIHSKRRCGTRRRSRRPATAGGEILAVFEDNGRDNAVDKVVGFLLERDWLARADVLAVSGRISFEIVQKRARAGLSGQPAFGLGKIPGLSGPAGCNRGFARGARQQARVEE